MKRSARWPCARLNACAKIISARTSCSATGARMPARSMKSATSLAKWEFCHARTAGALHARRDTSWRPPPLAPRKTSSGSTLLCEPGEASKRLHDCTTTSRPSAVGESRSSCAVPAAARSATAPSPKQRRRRLLIRRGSGIPLRAALVGVKRYSRVQRICRPAWPPCAAASLATDGRRQGSVRWRRARAARPWAWWWRATTFSRPHRYRRRRRSLRRQWGFQRSAGTRELASPRCTWISRSPGVASTPSMRRALEQARRGSPASSSHQDVRRSRLPQARTAMSP